MTVKKFDLQPYRPSFFIGELSFSKKLNYGA